MERQLQNINDLTRFLASLFKTECKFEIYSGHGSFSTHDGDYNSYLQINISPIYVNGKVTSKYNIGYPDYDHTYFFMVVDLDNDDESKITDTFKKYIKAHLGQIALKHKRKCDGYMTIIDFKDDHE